MSITTFTKEHRMLTAPRIGVLIPVYNEELVIRDTIYALVRAGVDLSDIYVVDDKSTDTTVDVARSCNVNVMTTQANGGKAAAQRAALSNKSWMLCEWYDWLVFLDGDTKVDVNFMHAMVEAATTDPSVALYLGQVRSAHDNHIFSAARAFEYAYGQEIVKKGQDNVGVVYVAPGCASMYRTNVLINLNIESDTLAEDMDLTIQIHRRGETVRYVDKAIVNTQDPSTLADYTKQVLRWTRGFWQIATKYQMLNIFRPKHKVDLYMMLVALDSLLFNRVVWAAIVLWFHTPVMLLTILLDWIVYLIIGMHVAKKLKRWDVVYKIPIFYWVSYINFYAFCRGFVEVVVLRKEILAWNKVKRYQSLTPST